MTIRSFRQGLLGFACLLSCLHLQDAMAGSSLGTLRITAVLIDSELQARPVPKHALLLKCGDAAPTRIVTGFDGKAELAANAGECALESERPAEFQHRTFRWDLRISIQADALTTIELSNENAMIQAADQPEPTAAPDFPRLFREWQLSVVTVWSATGHGSGFLVDETGIFLTNDHVVNGSGYVAVQFDENTKVRAQVLAADPDRDVAAIRINPRLVNRAKPVIIADAQDLQRSREGEPVFSIGSPLSQKRVMTTGIVSKIERRAIISDVNINPGNSGGPLFAADGKVLGITTFGELDSRGPGISGVVRIDQVGEVLARSREALASTKPPSDELLPVEPTEAYPVAAMKEALVGRTFKSPGNNEYSFGAGDFEVQFQTPVLKVGAEAAYAQELHKEQAKRSKKAGQAPMPNPALAEMRDWAQYVGENAAVFVVMAVPKLKEGFWSGLSRGLAASQGYYAGPAKLNFATDFVSMKLFCGSKEVQPIQPGRMEIGRDVSNSSVRVRDAAYYGFYSFPHDAINEGCGQVRLEIASLKKKGEPEVKIVPANVVHRVAADFAPYRQHLARLGQTGNVEKR